MIEIENKNQIKIGRGNVEKILGQKINIKSCSRLYKAKSGSCNDKKQQRKSATTTRNISYVAKWAMRLCFCYR